MLPREHGFLCLVLFNCTRLLPTPDPSHCPAPFLTSSWKQVARLLLLSLIPQTVSWSLALPQSSSSAHQILSGSSFCTSTAVKNPRQQAGGVELSEGATGRGFLHSCFKKL